MQTGDSRVCEAGDPGEFGEAQGSPPVSVRLTQDFHERGPEDPAEGVLTDAVRGEDPVAPRDVLPSDCGFGFVTEALNNDIDESSFIAYALDDVESAIEGIEQALEPTIVFYALEEAEFILGNIEDFMRPLVSPVCISLIKSFVSGGRTGLVRLQKVLPSIFLSFPVHSPYDILVKCGLVPVYPTSDCAFPSFLFQPELDGLQMISYQESSITATKKRKREPPPKPSSSSEQLQQNYERVRSNWEVSPAPNESNS